MSKKIYRCRYCKSKANKYATICSSCSVKLKLIRKIQKMIRDMVEREE